MNVTQKILLLCIKKVYSSRLGLVGHWKPMAAKKRHWEQLFVFESREFM
jgi:hypothetical protein